MEEVLNILKQMVEDGQISQEVAEKYCPEIKKYKDEIIKKQILDLIRQHSVNSDRCLMENWVCTHALSQIQPQPKQEWSEEDERRIEECAREAEDNNCIILAKHIRQLKSLRLHKQWKPSKEQVRVLEEWLKNKRYDGDSRYVYPFFQSLYEQLKQL